MQTESELAAAFQEHLKKYPLKLGGMPIEDWFELEAKREAEEQEEAKKSNADALPAPN